MTFQENDSPLPLSMKVASIVELFTSSFMKDVTNNFGEPIDYLSILKGIEESKLLMNYCKDNKDRFGITTCDLTGMRGCAWQSDCGVNEKCVDDSSEPLGYR